MKKILILAIAAVIALASCKNGEQPEQSITEKDDKYYYENDKLGWNLEIPENWQIVSQDNAKKKSESGKKAVEEAGIQIDDSKLEYLLVFKKNPFNEFQSTLEEVSFKNNSEWTEQRVIAKQAIYLTYLRQGIRVDTVSSKTKVDGIEFDVFNVLFYSPEGKHVLSQDLFSAFIAPYDFNVIITYNNPKDRRAMLNAFLESSFTK